MEHRSPHPLLARLALVVLGLACCACGGGGGDDDDEPVNGDNWDALVWDTGRWS